MPMVPARVGGSRVPRVLAVAVWLWCAVGAVSVAAARAVGPATLASDVQQNAAANFAPGVQRDVPANPVWPRQAISPVPDFTSGVSDPVVSLSGKWKLNLNPPANFWSYDVSASSWSDMLVPGQPTMVGYDFPADAEVAYRTTIEVPASFVDKAIVLQFEQVYSKARLWVNGQHVRDHNGGFTSWEADITRYVIAGKRATVTVGVIDNTDAVSWGTAGASGQGGPKRVSIGGILGGVALLALPKPQLTRFDFDTYLKAPYTSAVMRVYAGGVLQGSDTATLKLRLRDPFGKTVPLSFNTLQLSSGHREVSLDIPVEKPYLWDPEHPYLYTLEVTQYSGKARQAVFSRQVGFRGIEVDGIKLLVNGKEVKLRGSNSMNISPTMGRASDPKIDLLDIKQLRDANVNLIRPVTHPPTRTLLDLADKYGMFIEEEAPVTFDWNGSGNDPKYTAEFLDQFSEMVARDRSHPSVLMWSLGNEAGPTANFRIEHDYIKAEDPSRPDVFSMDDGCYGSDWTTLPDLNAVHYVSQAMDLGTPGATHWCPMPGVRPVFYDEDAPTAATTIAPDANHRDPNVHVAWGSGFLKKWEKIFKSPGAIGGTVFATADDHFLGPNLPNVPGGYCRLWICDWGMFDVWRRPKPEVWMTKKAYSPIRITDAPLPASALSADGRTLRIPVKNWSDFSNLNELQVEWSIGGRTRTAPGPDVAPHGEGTLALPVTDVDPSDVLELSFYRRGDPTSGRFDVLVDQFRLPFQAGVAAIGVDHTLSDDGGRAPEVREDSSRIRVSGPHFEISFSKRTGLIDSATFDGKRIIESGPYLNAGSFGGTGPWTLASLRTSVHRNTVAVDIRGSYDAIGPVAFLVTIDGEGKLTTRYTIARDLGRGSEIGVMYVVPASVDRLSWRRRGLWSVFPDDHIGRPVGIAKKVGHVDEWAVEPSWPWSQSMKQFGEWGKEDSGGRGTPDFRSSKKNILYASALLAGSDIRLRAESPESDNVRLELGQASVPSGVSDPNNGISFIDNNFVEYPSYDFLGWGNAESGTVAIPAGYTNVVTMRLTRSDGVPASVAKYAALGRPDVASVALTAETDDLRIGSVLSVTATFHNSSSQPQTDVRAVLHVPAGFVVTPTSPTQFASVPADSTVTTTWSVTVTAAAQSGVGSLTAVSSYDWNGIELEAAVARALTVKSVASP